MDNFTNFINKTNGKKLIIVDVQPAYQKYIHFMNDFAKFIEPYQEILCLYNGKDLGLDDKFEIANFYRSFGVKKETFSRMKWHEKNYAFFRDLIDRCWQREDIIKIIRFMLRNKKNDIRELSVQDVKKINVSDLVFEELENIGFNIPELAFYIKKWNGADICGGGLNECLEEVMLLADSLNLNLKTIKEFTY